MLAADAATGVVLRSGNIGGRVGAWCSTWSAWMTGLPGGQPSTGVEFSFGAMAQLVIRATPAPSRGRRVHFTETTIGAVVPIIGGGAFMLNWGIGWGAGV
jgi:hypothetical protein